ncbi:MAG: rhomboid family intramembrane serine protease [Oscillospiraceae bacterium]|nr:rhomboid family intramembrane serine protease [Oscillospiraceae bacterium]
MKNLRRRFDVFCFRHRDKGIPNLMLYISLGCALVYLMTQFTQNTILYDLLIFDRASILRGQVWRLISYPLTFYNGNLLLMFVALFCYYSLGRAIENVWGTLRFNLFYLCGILMMDIWCIIFGGRADVSYLNLSLFLSYATMYPQSQFLLLFIIPVKAWIFALFDLALVVYGLLVYPFPYNFFSVISLANYFLFFGKDVLNVVPVSWRLNARRLFRKSKKTSGQKPKVVPFPSAGSYEATVAKPEAPYTHKCTVCGRTDVTNPELEFRYCSRCKGYYCYCEDHISNHNHIE